MKRWEAVNCIGTVLVGKRRSGKDHNVLVTEIIVAHSRADAAAITKAHPRLKFFEKGRDA